MRRIAALIDPPDVIGVVGLILLAVGAHAFDPRLPLVIVGLALLLVAVAYARTPPAVPPAPPTVE